MYDKSVGGVTYHDACTDSSTQPDQVPCFSNSASFLTMLAPGAPVTAAGLTKYGTSQAAPHVAGSVAVLGSAIPKDEYSGTTMVRILNTGGPKIADPDSGVTKPRLRDLDEATFGPYSYCRTRSVSIPFSATGELQSDTCASLALTGEVFYDNLYAFFGATGRQTTVALVQLPGNSTHMSC